MNIPISIHDTNESPIARTYQETTIERSHLKLSSGDKAYLYGDTAYTGTLIHPIERTSPPIWTIKLERGGYEAVNIQHITVTEPSQDRSLSEPTSNKELPDLEIPFSDPPETRPKQRPILKAEANTPEALQQKIKILENTIKQLEAEQEASIEQNRRLKQENEILKKDLECAKQVIRRAKDIAPVMRLSLKRVLRLAHHACMDVERCLGGWILRMGDKARKFRRLWQVWDVVSQDEFILSEIFPPDKLIDVNLIQPPRRRRPKAQQKKTFPLMRPEDVMRRRTMPLVPSGLKNTNYEQ